jgi:hypothetical protein
MLENAPTDVDVSVCSGVCLDELTQILSGAAPGESILPFSL